MCGIAGAAGRAALASADGAQLVRSLRHRGPDDDGHEAWTGPSSSWQLAHTRLSIVDLSPAGAQPMANEDDSLVMVFNGEIYNSPDLRRHCEAKGHVFRSSMDGEVILHLWELEGPRSLTKLNGIFSFALASKTTGNVVLVRDPLGIKPLFFSVDDNHTLRFASEVAAVREMAPQDEPDTTALAQFLTFLWIPDPRSPVRTIRSLEPGHALEWTPEGVRTYRYTDPLTPPAQPSRPVKRGTSVQQARQNVLDASRRQLMADVPIGLMASGGIDSGLLWWAVGRELDRAYTITWSGGGDREGLDDDRQAVQELEEWFGTPVDFLPGEEAEDILPPSGDLFADPAYGLTRLIARRARERGHKVLLSGQGGDELFGGYRRHRIARLLPLLRAGARGAKGWSRFLARVPSARLATEYTARLVRAAQERDPFRGYMQLCTYSTPLDRAKALDCTEAEVADDVVWQRHQEVYDRLPRGLSFLRKVMAVDLAVYLPGLGLSYVDRAGMEFGVEVRVPLLDLELVRWSLGLPDSALVHFGREKWVTRELAAQTLPRRVVYRPKRAFAAPAGHVEKDGTAGSRGYRQAAYFARACRMLQEHLDGRGALSRGPVA